MDIKRLNDRFGVSPQIQPDDMPAIMRQGVQPRSIGLLVDIATLIEQAQEVGLEIGHGALLPWSAAVSMEGGQCKRIPYPITLPVRRRRFAP